MSCCKGDMNGCDIGGGKPERAVKADTLTHLLHCGLRDTLSGKIEGEPMLCIGWVYFKEKLDFELLKKEVLEKVIAKVSRYRAVAVERDGWTYFDVFPMSHLDLSYHFEFAGSFQEDSDFQKYLESIPAKGLDYSKPMWKYVYIEKLPCGRSGVLCVTNHTLGDGASQMSALLSMCEKLGTNPMFQNTKKARRKAGRRLTTLEKCLAFFNGASRPLIEAASPADTDTKLKIPNGKKFPTGFRFATTKPENQMDLKLMKEIKNRVGTGCTVNDVMLTLTTLVIKQYYANISDPIMVTKKNITATYAVNTRPLGVDYLSDKWFGNHIVVATAIYPLHRSRVDTLLHFRDSSRSRRASPEMHMRSFLGKLVATLVPRSAVSRITADTYCKFSIMISNVLLSLDRIKLFGQEIDDVQFLTFPPYGCYFGAASYAGKVNCNVVVAKDCDANPEHLLPYYNKELKNLHAEVMKHSSEYYEKLDKPRSASFTLYGFLIVAGLAIIVALLDASEIYLVQNLSLGLN